MPARPSPAEKPRAAAALHRKDFNLRGNKNFSIIWIFVSSLQVHSKSAFRKRFVFNGKDSPWEFVSWANRSVKRPESVVNWCVAKMTMFSERRWWWCNGTRQSKRRNVCVSCFALEKSLLLINIYTKCFFSSSSWNKRQEMSREWEIDFDVKGMETGWKKINKIEARCRQRSTLEAKRKQLCNIQINLQSP